MSPIIVHVHKYMLKKFKHGLQPTMQNKIIVL